MAPAERRRAVALDSAWDALVQGKPTPAPDPADVALTALAARLQATSAIPALFSEPEMSWRELCAKETAPTGVAAWVEAPTPLLSAPNSPSATLPERRIMPLPCRSPRRWLLNQLAMAALLLLALGAGFLLLWQAAVHERANETWLPNSVVSSLPGYAEEIVFQATFAADELPAGATEAVFYRTTLEPGANLPFLSAMAPFHSGYAKDAITTGVAAEFVESGSYEVVLDAPVSVQLGGSTGAKSEIAPRQTIALGPGDIAVYRRATAAGEIRNRGVDPVEVIGVAIVDFSDRGVGVRDVLPAGVTTRMLDATTTSDWTLLPAGPKQVTLRRVTLPARALLPPFQPRGLESIWVARGAIAWSFASNAASAVGGQRIHRQAGGIAPFVISPHGAQRILESTGDEPAELLVLTIEPAGLGGNPLAP